uniref:PP2C family protein-serine/threonine phosphatase n=1 Tax=Nonomuraea lactucae TaxID=2249762 RepID=UPI0013B3EB86
ATLASAGHLPPLLRRPGSPARTLDLPPGLVLGLDPGAEYTSQEVKLPVGSVLALYTDGLIEAPGTDLDQAIIDLAGTLTQSAKQPLHDLAETVIDHAVTVDHRTDDIALLLLKTTP